MICYSVTCGRGDIAYKAEYLVNSIRKFEDEAEIVVFIPREELNEVHKEYIKRIKDKARFIVGKQPIEEHPLLAKVKAMNVASEKTNAEYLLNLDTDMILLDSINIPPQPNADLSVVPLYNSKQYWASKASSEEWKKLEEEYDLHRPNKMVTTIRDQKKIKFMFNGAMVLSKNNDFPGRWLELSKKLWSRISDRWYVDQVALSLLASEYNVKILDESYNFPIRMATSPQDLEEVKILHYRDYRWFSKKFMDNRLMEKLKGTGILKRIKERNIWMESIEQFFEDSGMKTLLTLLNQKLKLEQGLKKRIKEKLPYMGSLYV